MSEQSPTASSQGQLPNEPAGDTDETWSPEQPEEVTNMEQIEGEDSRDFDEDETNPSPA